MDQFWLTDEQFAKMAPHLPTDTRGNPGVSLTGTSAPWLSWERLCQHL
jgi:hypothetical protein